ncbi:putative histone-like DNA-binding protein [Parabacteroides sp. PFB2-10]|uniref:HU family DNA-binding protein n=1 Tax=Parabacteroides sp. PFB2-10 TaxID=1742405 RepID=UPI002476FA31|nr:HU family DNA-binding protein [Parabacteroides sp. PFB2-10]MDH6312900.1 putative histone-like DNA-binding protein [Parabacteroides sp. PFB2-10]
MKVKVGIYQTPQPKGRESEQLLHARVSSKGTRRIDEICERLYELGLNSAQIKGILDGLARYIGESLRDGYHIEVEGIGTFSMSVKTLQEEEETGDKSVTIQPAGVNFKCSKKLQTMVNQAELIVEKPSDKAILPLAKRKKRLASYLEKKKYINQREYAGLLDLTIYQARKDLMEFVEEGFILQTGGKTRKIYILGENSVPDSL